MADLSRPGQDSIAAQQELFRRAKQKGLSLAVLHAADNNLKVSTMRTWASGETAMPAWALGALGEAGVPDHLLSLVTSPFGRCVLSEEDGEGDFDAAVQDAIEFIGAVGRARDPKSPGGSAIVPQERAVIIPIQQRATSSMQRARA